MYSILLFFKKVFDFRFSFKLKLDPKNILLKTLKKSENLEKISRKKIGKPIIT